MSQMIGKLVNSLVSGTNENNLSLANLSLDFALVKIDAPLEYLTVGQSLSSKRRAVAEQGHYHRIARTLGALFSALIPKAPKLRAAFGKRVSEIIKAPDTNPRGSRKDGPFEAYVGIDATSIWASATSGDPAIFVLLLACMLARNFADSRYSVAAWVEIVQTRQKEVLDSAETTGYLLNEAVVAAQQNIKREDLAEFDSSVRAWLSTADTVMTKNRKQLDLILDNLSPVPVSFEEDTYSRIVRAWISAIEGFEDILKGKPQDLMMDGSILLAFSAWHIYPNLIVLSQKAKMVDFQDDLVPRSGAVTLGFTAAEGDAASTGLRWSLTLSHLRYYGPAVVSVAADKNTRIDIEELQLMMLGAILARWNISSRHTQAAAACILKLCERLWEVSHGSDDLDWNVSKTPYSWIASARRMAEKYLSASKEQEKEYDHLVRHGRRLAKAVTHPYEKDTAFFGLSDRHTIHALTINHGSNFYVEHLRARFGSEKCWSGAPIRTEHAVVVYEIRKDHRSKLTNKLTVIATLIPYCHTSLNTSSGTVNREEIHIRWVIVRSGGIFTTHDSDGIKSMVSFGMPQSEQIILLFERDDDQFLKRVKSCIIWQGPPNIFADQGTGFHGCRQDWRAEICPLLSRCSSTTVPLTSPPKSTTAVVSPELHKPVASTSKKRKLSSSDTAVDDTHSDGPATIIMNLIPVNAKPYPVDVYICNPSVMKEIDLRSDRSESKSKSKSESESESKVELKLEPESESELELESESESTSGWLEVFDIPDLYDGTVQRVRRAFIQSRNCLCHRTNSPCYYSPADLYQVLKSTRLDESNLRSYFIDISKNWSQVLDQRLEKDGEDVTSVLAHVARGRGVLSRTLQNCLQLLGIATELYAQFPKATFPVSLLETILTNDIESYCATKPGQKWDIKFLLRTICFFETGGRFTSPQTFKFAFAVSAGNSLYVPEVLLSDPQESGQSHLVRRIIGNLGQPGVSVLASPASLMVKKKAANFRVVEHKPFDQLRQDSFSGVSLHLSLTNWKVPIHAGEVGLIDTCITLAEAVVQVRDKGHWIADINVMETVPSRIDTLVYFCSCTEDAMQLTAGENVELVCIDNFEELLDPPEESAIVRARENWPVRLAAACIIRQNIANDTVHFLPEKIACWECLSRRIGEFPEGTIFVD